MALSFAVLLSGLSCAGSQTSQGPASQGSDLQRCSALAKPAIDQALAEVAKHASCAADEDCVNVGIGSECFDVCSRAVNKNEVDAVNAALRQADCGEFKASGCQVTVPPCMPPQAPACKQGHCE